MKFMEKVETTQGDGLAIGLVKDGGICVSVRKGDKGPGQNLVFGWCEVHMLAFTFKEVCPRCELSTDFDHGLNGLEEE